ncbi:hypothetical protein [Ensifer sp. MJa1]|uniref:hypothetical protein n=1 Tax=Ensifer sp. MJa1 TaxID=2919888 RepID=UPI00300A5315
MIALKPVPARIVLGGVPRSRNPFQAVDRHDMCATSDQWRGLLRPNPIGVEQQPHHRHRLDEMFDQPMKQVPRPRRILNDCIGTAEARLGERVLPLADIAVVNAVEASGNEMPPETTVAVTWTREAFYAFRL